MFIDQATLNGTRPNSPAGAKPAMTVTVTRTWPQQAATAAAWRARVGVPPGAWSQAAVRSRTRTPPARTRLAVLAGTFSALLSPPSRGLTAPAEPLEKARVSRRGAAAACQALHPGPLRAAAAASAQWQRA
jgi:hypothetical protein